MNQSIFAKGDGYIFWLPIIFLVAGVDNPAALILRVKS